MADLTPEHPDDGEYHGNIADDVATGQVKLHVRMVSPQRELFAGDANWITAPGAEGSFGIWPRHVSMVAALSSGKLRVGTHKGEHLEYLVRGEFLSVNANVVTVLVDDTIENQDDIDVEVVRAELAEVNERLTRHLDDAEYIEIMDRRAWCQARIRFSEEQPDWVPKN